MNKPRALLVNPWIFDFKAYDFWLKPLGLLYLASLLRHYNWQVDYIDCLDRYHPLLIQQNFKSPHVDQYGRGKFFAQEIEMPEIYKNITRHYRRYGMPENIFVEILDNTQKPDFIFVTSIMTYWYPGVFSVIKILKKCYPKTPIILGGIYATLCTEHAHAFSGANYVMSGYAEEHLSKIISEIKPIRLFKLPYPAFDLYHKLDYACILTSRGCCFKCNYCAVPSLTPEFMYRNTASVIKEIEFYASLSIKNIAFYDDALLANPNFSDILEQIIVSKFNINFHTPNGLHPRFLTLEIAEEMYKANFKTIYLSLETTDPQIHQAIDDKVSQEEFDKAVQYLKQSGFQFSQIHAYLLIGLPQINSQSVQQSIDYVLSLGVTPHLAEYSPIPNTSVFDKINYNTMTDPLWHNNTIFPALNQKEQEQMVQIKTYLSHLRLKLTH